MQQRNFTIWGLLGFALVLILATSPSAQETTQETPAFSSVIAAQDPNVSSKALDILMVPLLAPELAEVAGAWQGHLRNALDETAYLNIALIDADASRAKQLRVQLEAETQMVNLLSQNYEKVLGTWERKGAVPEDLEAHRKYLSAFQIESVRTTDLRSLVRFTVNWVFSVDGGLGVLLNLGGVLVAIWIMMFIARFLRKLARDALENVPKLSNLLKSFILTAVYWGTFTIGILITLAIVGVNVTPLFAVVGGLSFILGFALQETLGNLASGLMIMVLKPFDMGDYIQTAGISGTVDEMSVVSTQIRTFDNQIIVVPNSKIWGDVITNVSASDTRRVDLVFGIGYTDNAAHAIKVLQALVSKHDLCLSSPEPEVFVGELGDSSVNIFCRPWCKSDDYWSVYWDLTGQAKERFDTEGISIPFPQRDVHIYQAGSPEETA